MRAGLRRNQGSFVLCGRMYGDEGVEKDEEGKERDGGSAVASEMREKRLDLRLAPV